MRSPTLLLVTLALLVVSLCCVLQGVDAGRCDELPPKPKSVSATHDSDRITIKWGRNGADDAFCHKIEMKVDSKKWKTMTSCRKGKKKVAYGKDKVANKLGRNWETHPDSVFKVRMKTVDKTVTDTCGKLSSKWTNTKTSDFINGGGGGGGESSRCEDVRLTHYTADTASRTHCGYRYQASYFPSWYRSNYHGAAVAEPWYLTTPYGDGFQCGTCYELSYGSVTDYLMVDNLCPSSGNEGNCDQPDHFHLDLTIQSAPDWGFSGKEAARIRPVACPFSGDIRLEIIDLEEWYMRVVPANMVIPIREVQFKLENDNQWREVPWSYGGAYQFGAGMGGYVNEGIVQNVGIRFRFISAQGETMTSSVVLTSNNIQLNGVVNMNVQFKDQQPDNGDSCAAL